MGIFDIFWFFLIMSALQPLLQQHFLERARKRMLEKIEKNRSSRVIVLVHRQETMSFLGFPILKYIDINDSEEVLRAIRLTDDNVPIDVILHTPGGLVLAAEQIAFALMKHKAKVTVFIPHYAMSGGSLIALSADEIVMDENAVLGPLDPQIGQYPAASIIKVAEKKPISEVDDQTLILADVSQKAISQMKNYVFSILKNKMDEKKALHLAEMLTTGKWTHDYPITVEQAIDMGLPVNTGIPEEIYSLMDLYPQSVQRRPSVEYIPLPYHKQDDKKTKIGK